MNKSLNKKAYMFKSPDQKPQKKIDRRTQDKIKTLFNFFYLI
jgi:hypothetical protein